MKLKTLGRITGAVNTSVGAFFGGLSVYVLSRSQYDLISIISSDLSFSDKLLTGGMLSYAGTMIPISTLLFVDGVTDMVKGTHHYFSGKLHHKLTKNPRTKKGLEDEFESELRNLEKEI